MRVLTKVLMLVVIIAGACIAGAPKDNLPIDIDDLPYEQAVKKLAIPFRKDLPQLFVSGDSISVGYGTDDQQVDS
jgi:hypothetical protein